MGKAMRLGAALPLAVTLLVGAPREAGALQASAGALHFAGRAVIPEFPCPAPEPGQFLCVGSFDASTAGSLSGVDGDSPWHVDMTATTNGEFSYADSVQPGVPCVEGTAAGTAALDTAAAGQAFGSYRVGNLVYTVSSVAITYSFTWARTGATAVMSVTDVDVRLQVDELGAKDVVQGGSAAAVATFVPHPDSGPPSGCVSGPPTSLNGSILGNVSGLEATP